MAAACFVKTVAKTANAKNTNQPLSCKHNKASSPMLRSVKKCTKIAR